MPIETEPVEPREAETSVGKNLLMGALGLLVAGAAFGFVSVVYRAELTAVTEWVFGEVGLFGVFVLLFVADAVATPVPTGSFLLVITATRFPGDWYYLVPAIGGVSALAGYSAYFGGRALADTRLSRFFFQDFREKRAAFIERAAPLAVALGALTPIPFAVTCWTTGLLGVPFRSIWAPCLLRIVRYFLLYAAVVYSQRFFDALL